MQNAVSKLVNPAMSEADIQTLGRSIMDSNRTIRDSVETLRKSLQGKMELSEFEIATTAIIKNNVQSEMDSYIRNKGMMDNYSTQFGPYIRHVQNLATIAYTTFELKEIISVQPLKQRIGALYYADFGYGSDKGEVTQGDALFSPFGSLKRNGTYVSEIVKNETVASSNGSYFLSYFPVYSPDNVQFAKAGLSYRFLNSADSDAAFYLTHGVSGTTTTYSTGKVKLAKSGVSIELTLATGELEITLPQSGVTVKAGSLKATYSFNSEQAYRTDRTKIPRLSLNVVEQLVTGQPRQLIFETNLLASFDFEKQFGQSLNSKMEDTALLAMQNSLAFQILDEMWAGAQTAETTEPDNPESFDVQFSITTGVSQFIPLEKSIMPFLLTLSRMSTAIRKVYGRGLATWVVGSYNLEALLRIMPDTYWKPVKNPDLRGGPYKAGRLANAYDVYINPAWEPDDIMVGYRGAEWYEASYFVGSYVPIMAGQFMMFPDFQGQQGYFAVEALRNIFPHMCVRGHLYMTEATSDLPVVVQNTTENPVVTDEVT